MLGHRPDHAAERGGQSPAGEGLWLPLCQPASEAPHPNGEAAPHLWPPHEDNRHHQIAEQSFPPAHVNPQARAAGQDAGYGPRRAGPARGFACGPATTRLYRDIRSEHMSSDTRKNGSKGPRILIVDDDSGQRSLLDSFLRSQGFETVPVASGEQALETLRAGGISMMISDVRMPGMSGLETMRRARQEHAVLPILLVTAYADIREAVGAMRDGALNYLAKPIDLDELLVTVQQAIGITKPVPLKFSADKQLPAYVVAKSPLLQAVFHDASLIAASESRILITGESGAGKEVIADVIHAWSARAAGPLVKVNCAAIPETLVRSKGLVR